jgi:mono/diheme cytochrome c family protein
MPTLLEDERGSVPKLPELPELPRELSALLEDAPEPGEDARAYRRRLRWRGRLGFRRRSLLSLLVLVAAGVGGGAVLAHLSVLPQGSRAVGGGAGGGNGNSHAALLARGAYLAEIGACAACHTPPAVPAKPPAATDSAALERERQFRTDPDWVKYLDSSKPLAGGVPFLIRLPNHQTGVVYSTNITPDRKTGIGSWSKEDIVRALQTGVRKDGSSIFLFAPHTFYAHMADRDALALAVYLKSLQPIKHEVPARSLPFTPQPAEPTDRPAVAPEGQTRQRAEYLTTAIVGCVECHSYHGQDGALKAYVGGDPTDAYTGVFRLGPDLPLRADERGFAAFPFPGWALLYAPNLTVFGRGGPLSDVPLRTIVRAIRHGVAPDKDAYGRPEPLAHVMLWQFYGGMADADANAIAGYLKSLHYVPHDTESPVYFGEDWRAMFERVFGEQPTPADEQLFGKAPKEGH